MSYWANTVYGSVNLETGSIGKQWSKYVFYNDYGKPIVAFRPKKKNIKVIRL